MYKRVLIKLSGESLMGGQSYGIDEAKLSDYASQIKDIVKSGVQTGIVIGGGNIFRGLSGIESGFDRVKGDYMGMLATVINGLAIQNALEKIGIKSRLFTAINMQPVGERFSKRSAIESLENTEVAIFTFGTGNPFFTTDTAAALRGVEIEAEVILKGTRVDGVYSADPEKDRSAVRFDNISFDEAYDRGLKIMDLTAITLCRENNIRIIVFNINIKGNLLKAIKGEKVGTLIKN